MIVPKIVQDPRDAFWKTDAIVCRLSTSVPLPPRPGPKSDGCHHSSLSIVTAPRFNGCRSNLASNFGPGFKTPQSSMSGWAQGRTTVPRAVPYFITESWLDHHNATDRLTHVCALINRRRQIQDSKIACITEDGTVFSAAQ